MKKYFLLIFLLITPIVQTSFSQYTESCEDPKDQKAIIPIDLEYEVKGGAVIAICKVVKNIEVVAIIDAHDEGQITIHIPKKLVYSLVGTECEQGLPLIIYDNREAPLVNVSSTEFENIITVGFTKGKHSISFIGSVIMPDPSPVQYCGIVIGHDSLYLSPKFQLKRGLEPEQVRCNEGLQLMILKSEKPVCVKPYTTEQLIKRGLANPHSCTNTLFADPGNESITCFCRENEQLVSVGYYVEKSSSLQLVRKEIVSNQFNQVGIEVEFFNPEQSSHYAYVWADCR